MVGLNNLKDDNEDCMWEEGVVGGSERVRKSIGNGRKGRERKGKEKKRKVLSMERERERERGVGRWCCMRVQYNYYSTLVGGGGDGCIDINVKVGGKWC